MAPQANIVCFRHLPGAYLAGPELDAHQARLRKAVIQAGTHYLVQTDLHGQTYLRVTLMNPRTTEADLEGLLAALRAAASVDG